MHFVCRHGPPNTSLRDTEDHKVIIFIQQATLENCFLKIRAFKYILPLRYLGVRGQHFDNRWYRLMKSLAHERIELKSKFRPKNVLGNIKKS